MDESLEQKLMEQRWRRRRNVAMVVGAVLIFLLTLGALAYWWLDQTTAPTRPSAKRGLDAERYTDPPNKLNVVILGVDSRPQEDDPGRSDTLLVMTIDTVSHDISLISIPRDTRVRIPGQSWDKINHAFMFGGVALTQRTVEDFLGIPLNYYAKVDLKSFGRIVDAIGGVTIAVEKRMQYEDTWDHFVIDLMPGVQRLDGRTALQYVRYRDEEGDIGRVARQQKFIKALLAEVNTPMIMLKAPGIIREVFAALDTDMPLPLMFGVARKMKDGLGGGIRANTVEGLPYYIEEISYWIPDVMKMRQTVAEMQGVAFVGYVESAARRLADEYRRYLPANAHLDDGSYYYGIDAPPKALKPTTPPKPALTPIVPKPATPATPATPPATGNKDGVVPKK
jgi:polyisoprenyl-teichoic acid--peptidoglycan teichoic acid transferase